MEVSIILHLSTVPVHVRCLGGTQTELSEIKMTQIPPCVALM